MKRKDGQPKADNWANRREATVEEYIANRTTRADNGCLLWRGARPGRVGWFQYKVMFETTSAPICVYQVRVGSIPKGLVLRHTCDDPRCVETTHLIPGTQKQNRRDFMERHPRAMELCLTAQKVALDGTKKMWASMSEDERAAFIERRTKIQREKYPPDHPMHEKRLASVRAKRAPGSPSQKKQVETRRRNFPPGDPMYRERARKIWETRRRNGTDKKKISE